MATSRNVPTSALAVGATLVASALVANLLASRDVSAADLGSGLDVSAFSQTTHEFAPAVKVEDTFGGTGDLNSKQLQISGTSMAATNTGAPVWAALTTANKFTINGSGAATRTTAVSATNRYSPARIPWMGRKFRLQGSLASITTSTSAGFLILAASNGNSGIAAEFTRSPNTGASTDRWKVRIVQINSVASGVANTTVIASANLFNNSTTNPVGSRMDITMDFNPNAANNLSVTGTDGGGNSASVAADVSTSAGVYAGLVSFAPSSTTYPNFEVKMS